jgi:hypothetical protein
MDPLPAKGVVKNGQIVLETPLDLPDGTEVSVLEYGEADFPSETKPLSAEARKELILAVARRPDLADDPEWEAKLWGATLPPTHPPVATEIMGQITGMWAHREEMNDPEAWVRRMRGNRL